MWTSILAAHKLLLSEIRQKIHLGYGVNVLEDTWIPILPARPARPSAPIWITGKLCSTRRRTSNKKFGHQPKLFSTLFAGIIQRVDNTFKPGYWVARNFLEEDEEK